ncbi:hypothetical protein BDP81DRAFT_57083 [Colletotrichum phormii]|uniref:Uncharacterized protein n=1 Tax=Colletotrichum phormii TaxID=359342 RepID=A0AAI9ZMC1_9PEZI|nr:uncharacterized protein BDP81DRAFT_57083 [Colletotrichum phormii]KAK1634311.1 hypothetical protein BDP81DRAFT_57083 [Colletotrichum phormii]
MSPVPYYGPPGQIQQTNTGPDHNPDQRMTHYLYHTQVNSPFRSAPNHQGIRTERWVLYWMRQRLQGQASVNLTSYPGERIVADTHVSQLDAPRQRASQDQGRKGTAEGIQTFTAKASPIVAPQTLNRSHCEQQFEYIISLHQRPLRRESSTCHCILSSISADSHPSSIWT